jgi:hypothetical protein
VSIPRPTPAELFGLITGVAALVFNIVLIIKMNRMMRK